MSKNKDEEIKLYLSAITTRDPSKRQIKPVDKDAFQLFDDLESGSDEDFVVGSDELSDDQQIESEENISSNDENDDEDEIKDSSDSDSSNNIEPVSKKSEMEIKMDDTDKYSCDVKIASKTKIENVMICMMCLLDTSFSDNEIIECDSCGIVVHEDCYKISDSVFMSCDASDSSTDPWFCDACLSNVKDPRCELCPVDGGVFKRTENNRWVHLLCALYTPGVAFNDIENLSEITLSELPLKDWSARECTICTYPFYARTGVCISCDAGLCKNVFHVLCAQKEGLLSEPNNEENSDDPYFANCRQHTDKEVVKRRRKNWNAAVNRQKLRIEEWRTNDHFNDSRLIRKREFFSSMFYKSLETVPTPFVPITKVPCFLETNPVAVFLFKKKATNLRLPQDVLNVQTTSDMKTHTSGIPIFGPDFITYFLDREKKIDETTSDIDRLEGFSRELQISEQNTSHQFNKTVARKETIYKEYRKQLEELIIKIDVIKHLVKNRELTDMFANIMNMFEPMTNGGSGNGTDSIRSGGDRNNSSTNIISSKIDSVINECYMCKSVRDQHLLIDCDNCHKFIHIGCLDPPLTRMPRKTKLYGWQCSLCTCGTTDDDQEHVVDVNRPRQLRRSSGIHSKYSHAEILSSTNKCSKKLLKKSKERSMSKKRTRTKSFKEQSIKNESHKSKESQNDIPKSIDPPEIKIQECKIEPEIETESPDLPKPQPLCQRKSDRPRKRPLTLLDEYETTVTPKRPRLHKILKSMGRKNTKSLQLKRRQKQSKSLGSKSMSMLSRNITSDQSTVVSADQIKQQPITFYPSSETMSLSSSKNSTQSERMQIGVVAKKPSSSLSTNQKCLEKKSILIKCHDEQDDEEKLSHTEAAGLERYNGRQGGHFVDI